MSAGSDETIPQIALFIQESSVRPPPRPHAASSSVPRASARAPRPMILPLPHLPPPPPPPPPEVPSTSTSQIHNTVYQARSPQPSTSYAISHAPPAVPEFDARRPPPPIPTHVQRTNNALKRSISHNCTVPSKSRRTEPKAEEAPCDKCVQREISIENYRIKLEKISTEAECQTLLFKKKMTEYQRQKDILRSLVDGDVFRKADEFGEDVPPYNFRIGSNNLNDSFLAGPSTSNTNQMHIKFMDYLFSESAKFEPSPSSSVEDSLRQTLSTMARSPIRRSSPDILQTLQEILHNEDRLSSSERRRSSELTTDPVHSPVSNGVNSYRRYSNGQRVEQRAPPPPAPLPPPSVPFQPPSVPSQPPPPPAPYPHYPAPRAYYPPPHMTEPRPSTSRAPPPPNTVERYPSPYYYYQ